MYKIDITITQAPFDDDDVPRRYSASAEETDLTLWEVGDTALRTLISVFHAAGFHPKTIREWFDDIGAGVYPRETPRWNGDRGYGQEQQQPLRGVAEQRDESPCTCDRDAHDTLI